MKVTATDAAVLFVLMLLLTALMRVAQAASMRSEDCRLYGFAGVSWQRRDWDWPSMQPRWCVTYGDGFTAAQPISMAAQNHYIAEYLAGKVRP